MGFPLPVRGCAQRPPGGLRFTPFLQEQDRERHETTIESRGALSLALFLLFFFFSSLLLLLLLLLKDDNKRDLSNPWRGQMDYVKWPCALLCPRCKVVASQIKMGERGDRGNTATTRGRCICSRERRRERTPQQRPGRHARRACPEGFVIIHACPFRAPTAKGVRMKAT